MSDEHNKILKKWGLSGNPVGTTPPDEIEQIAAIFHGRDHELDMALFTLYDGKNVLIRGTWKNSLDLFQQGAKRAIEKHCKTMRRSR
jgi:hypothetical protein